MPGFLTPPVVMAIVAAVLAAGATYALTRPARSEAAIYARRIIATMLGAGAVILGGFAYALESWGAAS